MLNIVEVADLPAPGATDCRSFIWVRKFLPSREKNLVLRHEQYHCNAQHARRAELFAKQLGEKELNQRKWNIATDLEIARAIYTDEDEQLIRNQMSNLKGGITRDYQNINPKVVIAEELYELISEPPQEHSEGFDEHQQENPPEPTETDEKNGEMSPAQLRSEAQKTDAQTREEQEQKEHNQRQQSEVQAVSTKLMLRHTIASEIDTLVQAAAGRSRNFSRPSRRDLGDDILNRADVRADKKPQVLLYVDRSGSFSPEKTEEAEKRIKRLTAQYGWRLRLSSLYFGDGELRTKDNKHGGDTPYQLVAKHIDHVKPKLAIIITDNDGHNPYVPPPGTRIAVMAVGCPPREALKSWEIRVRE